ncbi:hypothetical protein J4G33_06080 [Actinotalea sp. BY-33]|uniref:Uncharacterized protein n=1 Tax=Actinotalea soli TaxID=2819234 RepID=A0A939LU58_9CELL|nr:hypothetical protein [Actinotalea soli]MBO1751367.1 hypothetical protein [Actinotalea soli]
MIPIDWFDWALTLVLLALAFEFIAGGMVRGISPIPSDTTFRKLSRVTWWVSPLLLVAAGAGAGWALRTNPPIVTLLLVVTIIEATLSWHWRPARAEDLWVPQWLATMRAAVPVPIRDAAAWRRQAVGILVGIAILAAAVTHVGA